MDPPRLRVRVSVKFRIWVDLTLTRILTLILPLTRRTTSVEFYLHRRSPPEVYLQSFELNFLSGLFERIIIG